MDLHALPSAADFPHRVTTDGPGATTELGRRIARGLSGGEVLLLYGDLGAGKTCLVQGICAELAVDQEVVSPTFTLVNTYDGRLRVHHLDFYRLEPGHDLNDVGLPDLLDEVFDDAAVLMVEWPGPMLGALAGYDPPVELLVTPGDGPDRRVWHLRQGPVAQPAWTALFPLGPGDDPC